MFLFCCQGHIAAESKLRAGPVLLETPSSLLREEGSVLWHRNVQRQGIVSTAAVYRRVFELICAL